MCVLISKRKRRVQKSVADKEQKDQRINRERERETEKEKEREKENSKIKIFNRQFVCLKFTKHTTTHFPIRRNVYCLLCSQASKNVLRFFILDTFNKGLATFYSHSKELSYEMGR